MSTFTMTIHQVWSCHVALSANFENYENFYFSPNSILNFRKSYQIWGIGLKNEKITGKKQNPGWKTPLPPPPSRAYRVKPDTAILGLWRPEDKFNTLVNHLILFSSFFIYKFKKLSTFTNLNYSQCLCKKSNKTLLSYKIN